jgi:hypothetical protein
MPPPSVLPPPSISSRVLIAPGQTSSAAESFNSYSQEEAQSKSTTDYYSESVSDQQPGSDFHQSQSEFVSEPVGSHVDESQSEYIPEPAPEPEVYEENLAPPSTYSEVYYASSEQVDEPPPEPPEDSVFVDSVPNGYALEEAN